MVRYQNTDAIAFNGFERRPWCLSVIAPTVDNHSRCELAFYRLSREMKFLHAVHHFRRQTRSVRRDDGWICAVRRCWRGRLCSHNFHAVRDALEQGGTADHRGGSDKTFETPFRLSQLGLELGNSSLSSIEDRQFQLPCRARLALSVRFLLCVDSELDATDISICLCDTQASDERADLNLSRGQIEPLIDR